MLDARATVETAVDEGRVTLEAALQQWSPNVLSVADSREHYGAPYIRIDTTVADLRNIGDLENVILVTPDPGDGSPLSSAYYDLGYFGTIDGASSSWDGSGRRVAIVEGGRPDTISNTPGVLPGATGHSCSPTGGTALCHCPSAAPPLATKQHCRQVAGVVRNSVTAFGPDTAGGVADDSNQMYANIAYGSCTTDGPDIFSSGVNWAINEGASVLNFSWEFGLYGDPQSTYERFVDWRALTYPWPTFVAAAGNRGVTSRVVNKLYNGIIVGGADDHGSSTRSGATLYDVDATSGTSSVNWSPSGTAPKFGFELPHLAAAAVGVDAAGAGPGWVDTVGGTSLAAPQISALVADIQEGNPTIAYWPEVMQVGLMASANENIDEAYSGVWPPSLSDNVDDKDGAGLVHAWLSAIVLSSGAKQNGGNPAIHYGHDYGSVYASSTPAGTLYPEEYTVSVPPACRRPYAFTLSPAARQRGVMAEHGEVAACVWAV
jgi:hypothetical protein